MMRFIAYFFNSYPGMYIAQSFCHSVVAAIIIGRAMKSWRIYDPLVRQRFRLAVIVIPIISFPLYQAMNAARSSTQFRLEALFDVNRWLMLEIGGLFPVGVFFLIMLAATALIFLFQEMIPVLYHTFRSRQDGQDNGLSEPNPFLKKASSQLGIDVPGVSILEDTGLILFSTTGKQPVISVSSELAAALTRDQMKAALAHELAHIARNKRPLLIAVFVLRVLLFFNPVVLVAFRRAVRDEEKICDDISVALTGNREALAAALAVFYRNSAAAADPIGGGDSEPGSSLEEQSERFHLESRIRRLQQPDQRAAGAVFPFAAAVVVTVVLNYFVV